MIVEKIKMKMTSNKIERKYSRLKRWWWELRNIYHDYALDGFPENLKLRKKKLFAVHFDDILFACFFPYMRMSSETRKKSHLHFLSGNHLSMKKISQYTLFSKGRNTQLTILKSELLYLSTSSILIRFF